MKKPKYRVAYTNDGLQPLRRLTSKTTVAEGYAGELAYREGLGG